ncbi:MAG: hypothetical protein BAJALOKI3v1_1020013 [Promethearchaeota archaeon]|nr:MAG: hypothetical protein BAJALOKI3v1_1020013 [Candidatus Lokiarchaeota archaeon]
MEITDAIAARIKSIKTIFLFPIFNLFFEIETTLQVFFF